MVELEQNIIPTLSKIAFLVMLLICNKDLVNTTVYHKKTNSDLYINWKSFTPNNGK